MGEQHTSTSQVSAIDLLIYSKLRDAAGTTKPEAAIALLLTVIHRKEIPFSYAQESDPLAGWLDSEWEQFGMAEKKPTLVIANTGGFDAGCCRPGPQTTAARSSPL